MNWTTNSTGTFTFYATEQSGSSWADLIAEIDLSEGHREYQEAQSDQYIKFKQNEQLYKFSTSDKPGVAETAYYLIMAKMQQLRSAGFDSEKVPDLFDDIAILSTITNSVWKKKV